MVENLPYFPSYWDSWSELVKTSSFRDILEGQFQIDEIIRVDQKNDEHTITKKTFDFSSETIKLLLEGGYSDAYDEFYEYIRNQLMKTVEE